MSAAGHPNLNASIRTIIDSKQISTHFQPIVSTRQRTIVGLEGLARSPQSQGHLANSAGWLFHHAAKEALTAELEQLTCQTAISTFAGLPGRPGDLLLFMNGGGWLAAETAVDRLHDFVRSASLSADKIAVEILEDKVDDIARLEHLVRVLRGHGFLLALDDVGSGHSNLDRIPLIRPDVLKIDRSLIAHIHDDFYKQETLKSLVGLARKIGALVVAEGVETEDEAIVALELGADLMQGYFLSRPSEVGALHLGSDASARVELLNQKFKRYMVGKINERKLQHRRFNIVINEVLSHLGRAAAAEFEGVLGQVVGNHPDVECVYVLNANGIQVTETVCQPGAPYRHRGVMFHPASKGTDHSLKEYYYILLDVELPKFTTDPYVSFASGNICRTISTYFRDEHTNSLYVLCIDVAV